MLTERWNGRGREAAGLARELRRRRGTGLVAGVAAAVLRASGL